MKYRTIRPKKGKAAPYPHIQVLSPSGGLNTLISDTLIKDTEASDLNNIQFVESGCPAKTTGKSTWGTGLTNTPRGLGTFNTTGGTRYIVTIDGTALKSSTAKGGAWSAVSGATFTANQDVTFTQARGSIFIWNGTDGGAYWDGTTLSRPGTMPSAAFSIFYSGYHIAAGTGTKGSRLYFSDTYDATKFTIAAGAGTTPATPNNATDVPGASVFGSSAAQMLDVAPDDGSVITGIAKFKDVLVVFKNNAIYQITFSGTNNAPVVTPIINYIGAISHRSIDNVNNDVYYLSRLGWMVLGNEPQYFTIIRTNELSARIHPLIANINPSNLSRVNSIYSPSRYMFFSSFPLGGSTTNNRTVTYDTRYGAWSQLDIIHANAFTVYVDSANTEHLLYASDDESKVYELDASNYSDNGSAINAYWTSKAFDAGETDLYKRWIDLTLLFRQITGTITVTVIADNNQVVHSSTITSGAVDGGIGQYAIGAELFGGNISSTTTSSDTTATNNIPYRIRINTASRTLKVTVSNANNNETFVLLGLYLTYRPYSHFKFPSTLKIN